MRLFPRGKKGILQYEFELNGITYRESTKTKNKQDALTIMNQKRQSILLGQNGIAPKSSVKLFRVAVDEYIESRKAEWSPDTLRMHNNSKPKLVEFFGKMTLPEITVGDIRKYKTQRKAAPSKATGKPVSNRTINIEITLLRQVLVDNKLWVKMIEGEEFRMLKTNKDVGRELTELELTKLLEACRESASKALYPAVLLAIYTGLRNKELRTLKWEQINFERSTIMVGVSKNEGSSGRVVHFYEDAYRLLCEWKSGFAAKPNHYVFPSQRYGLMGEHQLRGGTVAPYRTYPDKPTRSLNTSWRTAQRVAGVHCRWHDLRHTCTSLLARSGASDATLMSMLGWMSPRMIELYSHSSTRDKQQAVTQAGSQVREILQKLENDNRKTNLHVVN